MTRARKVTLTTIAIVLASATGGTAMVLHNQNPTLIPVPTTKEQRHLQLLGVVTVAPTTKDLNSFADEVDVHPNLDEYYIPWGRSFSRATASSIASAGALPMISWEPFTRSTTLSAIARGKQDRYIERWAHAIASYSHPIALSFAAEMNGHWENWGPRHATAAQFVSAWRHIHNIFRLAGATNVKWVWTVNIINGLHVSLRPYWPGMAYVDWIGVNGYWWGRNSSAGLTFTHIFGPTLVELRQFTDRPVLITETGGAPGWKVTAVHDLFAGVEHTPGMLGFVWFDINARAADWQLQDSPSALAAFRYEAQRSRSLGAKLLPTNDAAQGAR